MQQISPRKRNLSLREAMSLHQREQIAIAQILQGEHGEPIPPGVQRMLTRMHNLKAVIIRRYMH